MKSTENNQVKNMATTLKSIGISMMKIVAEHMAMAIATLAIIGFLVGLYYAYQQGIIDDKSDEIIEIPLGK